MYNVHYRKQNPILVINYNFYLHAFSPGCSANFRKRLLVKLSKSNDRSSSLYKEISNRRTVYPADPKLIFTLSCTEGDNNDGIEEENTTHWHLLWHCRSSVSTWSPKPGLNSDSEIMFTWQTTTQKWNSTSEQELRRLYPSTLWEATLSKRPGVFCRWCGAQGDRWRLWWEVNTGEPPVASVGTWTTCPKTTSCFLPLTSRR